ADYVHTRRIGADQVALHAVAAVWGGWVAAAKKDPVTRKTLDAWLLVVGGDDIPPDGAIGGTVEPYAVTVAQRKGAGRIGANVIPLHNAAAEPPSHTIKIIARNDVACRLGRAADRIVGAPEGNAEYIAERLAVAAGRGFARDVRPYVVSLDHLAR